MKNITSIYSYIFVLFTVAIVANTALVPAAEAWHCNGLTATPQEVFAGEEVKLKWDAPYTDIAYVTIDKIPGKQFARDGFALVNPTETTTYTAHMHKDGAANTLTCSTKVTVKVPPPVLPTCTLAIDKTVVPVAGGDVVLTWTTDNANAVSFNRNIGAVAVDGTRTELVTESSNFVLTATGPGGTVQCTKSVTVEVPAPAPECTLAANPTALPIGGGSTVLTWTTKNATSVSFDQGIGVVAENGTRSEALTTSKSFVLTVTGAGGTVSCPVAITVPNTPEPLTCSDVTFSASDTSVRRGENVTLNWNWNGRVTSASIDQGIGDVSTTGTREVTINGDVTYTMVIKNATSEKSCPVAISVESGGGGGGGSSSPKCELKASKTKIKAGESVTLTWETSRATEVVLKDSFKKTLLDTDDISSSKRADYYDADMKVNPTKDTTYTLTASKGTRDRVCKVSVDVTDAAVTVSETRNQPLIAGISLSQVPYTGFEAGPALTVIFYTLLTLWALFVAYLLVIRRDRVAGVALPGAYGATQYVDQSREAAATVSVSPAAAYVASVATSAPANLPVAVAPAVIGYQNYVAPQSEEEAELSALENRAHSQKALLSSDAMRYLIHTEASLERRAEKLDAVVRVAKVTFPTEDGWIVLNLARMEALLGDLTKSETVAVAADVTPTASGSLAEAIVTGNVVAAFAMIQDRPMVALADAAADLDAIYRVRKGETVMVSDLLREVSGTLSDEQLAGAIAALTSAIDGTYQDEAEAVKMAIMKSIKVVA